MEKKPVLALVTGATSGIGRAICELLAKKGVNLIATGRNQAALNVLKQEMGNEIDVTLVVADLAKKEARQKIIEQIHQKAPDLVINNAGFGLYGGCLTYQTQEQEEIIEVNGTALVELTLEAARTLISKGKAGTVVNVSSAAAFQIFPNMAVYSASKAFVNQFSQAFDFEVRPYGVRVLTICPGMVATHFRERAGGFPELNPLGTMTPDFVAQEIWKQMQKQKLIQVIDWKYYLLSCLSYLAPNSWVANVLKRKIDKRLPPRNLIKINT